jgi:hypothetical protein
MPPLGLAPCHYDQIGRCPPRAGGIFGLPSRSLLRGSPAAGLIMRFTEGFLRALHESRSDLAQREIDRVRHLIPTPRAAHVRSAKLT